MKKLFAILMALMALCFTQCKPTPDGGDDETRKVKVSCVIPLNNGSRSDFTNLLTNGKVNWAQGAEYVYLAIHGDNPKIVQLRAHANGTPSVLKFEGTVEEGLIKPGEEYDIWYFGDSHETADSYYEISDDAKSLSGSIAKQSGRLEDLGDCHIATTRVVPTITEESGDVKLSLAATLKNQIAIALLDLKNVTELYGDAIIGTDYRLEYNGDRYELKVVKDEKAKISIVAGLGADDDKKSYVVLFPNDKENAEIRYNSGSKVYECLIYGDIKANNLYYQTATDGVTIGSLSWSEVSSGDVEHGDHVHHYVDLGLPSGTLWATRNVGADTIYEYGEYYTWGETAKKNSYVKANCTTNDANGKIFSDIAGTEYDVAKAIWGSEWRMPTDAEQRELYSYCRMEIVKMPTPEGYVNGYMFISTINGNHIFLPASGYRDGEQYYNEITGEPTPIPEEELYRVDSYGHYLSSTPCPGWNEGVQLLNFEIREDGGGYVSVGYSSYRYYGCSVRPVLVKKANEIKH